MNLSTMKKQYIIFSFSISLILLLVLSLFNLFIGNDHSVKKATIENTKDATFINDNIKDFVEPFKNKLKKTFGLLVEEI